MNKDQFKGKEKVTEGKLEESAGEIVDDEEMERSGKRKKAIGEIQSEYGDVKSDIKESE